MARLVALMLSLAAKRESFDELHVYPHANIFSLEASDLRARIAGQVDLLRALAGKHFEWRSASIWLRHLACKFVCTGLFIHVKVLLAPCGLGLAWLMNHNYAL